MQAASQRNPGSLPPDVFAAIGDPTRRRLLDLLSKGPQPVNDLARPFRMTRPAISQHLRILRDAGLVRARREGRYQYYRLRAERLRQVYDWVSHYQRFWKEKLGALRDYLDRTQDQAPGQPPPAEPEEKSE